MTFRSPARITVVTAVSLTLVLLAGIVTASYRIGVREGALAGLPAEFAVLGDVHSQLSVEAVRVPPDAELAAGALRGMLGTLEDPYAVYYDPAAFAQFNDLLDGSFSGVGLMLEEAPGGVLQVVNVLPGTPAQEAGVEVGERIVAVDGEDVRDVPIELVVRRVQGPEGTQVRLGLEGGSQGPREVAITRARIRLPNLEARMLEGESGYVRLLQFNEGVGAEVREAVTDLLGQGARGIVLDLRGNPGGLLREAVTVASAFIDDGTIVSVREREGRVESFSATGDALADVALVVLVDKGSASASEIVAGAVQDAGRGTVVGVATFGKGTVQIVRPLRNGGGVKFTTAEYLTPSGDSIEGVGVKPDIEAAGDADAQLETARKALGGLIAAGAG